MAIAVSGGADSFSLLHKIWAAGWSVIAFTVDHGLRDESADEAAAVARWCAARDIPHETLHWRGDKPVTGKQSASRTARYRLLCEACNRLKLKWLVTGHTGDDQAETVFMRLRRGSGRGLAAMLPRRRIASGAGEPITLCRPMLQARRSDVAEYAAANALPVQNDPSNEDNGYERIRIRSLLGALEQQDLLTVDALCRVAESVAVSNMEADLRFRRRAQLTMAETVWGYPEYHPGGWVLLRSPREDIATIERVLGVIGEGAKVSIGLVNEVGRPSGVTVGGCCIVQDGASLSIFREPATLLGRADGSHGFDAIGVKSGDKLVYDRRFIVQIPDDLPIGTVLRPLGQLFPRAIATSTLARQRISSLPCLSIGHNITHIPVSGRSTIFGALAGWKDRPECLSDGVNDFETHSLFAERFFGDVIRY